MFRVAEGRAITTGRGIRGAGAIVRPADFRINGDQRIADLLARGLVVMDAPVAPATQAAPAAPATQAAPAAPATQAEQAATNTATPKRAGAVRRRRK